MDSYQSFVAAQSKRNPSIQNLCKFLTAQPSYTNNCRIAALDFSDQGYPLITNVELTRLELYLHPPWNEGNRNMFGRILIVEDLTKHIVEIIGSKLQLDPLFFASHLHQPWPEITAQTPGKAMLPSRQRLDTYYNMHFHRTIVFQDTETSQKNLFRACNMERKVTVLPKTKRTRIGLAQHSCSIFKSILPNGAWICVILVDPPIANTYHSVTEDNKELLHLNLESSHFLGGYEDFLDSSFPNNTIDIGPAPPRTGMFDDLIYYWTRQQPSCFDPKCPSLLQVAYYPLRIVAAEWVSYFTVMNHSMKEYEYTVGDLSSLLQELDKLNSDLQALQSWRRRSMSSLQKLQSVTRFIRHRHADHGQPWRGWDLLAEDYEQLTTNAQEYGQHFERTLPVVTSMVQIVDSRRSFAETANVGRLTYLAMVFVPLTFTTGLFSMNDNTLPGSSEFWLFFAVSIPMTLIVFLVARPPVRWFQMVSSCVDNVKKWKLLLLNNGDRKMSNMSQIGSKTGDSHASQNFIPDFDDRHLRSDLESLGS